MKADVALLRLPAPSLRGTFAKAYSLLTRLVAKIGWDELLKCRSSVFVMEEEYRMQKAAEEERKSQKTTINPPPPQEKENNKEIVANVDTKDTNDVIDSSQTVPAITISEDSNVNDSEDTKGNELENPDEKADSEKKDNDVNEIENSNSEAVDERSINSENMEEVNLDDEKSNSNSKPRTAPVIEFKGPELEKPLQAANEDKSDNQSIHNDEQSKVKNHI